MVQVQGWLIHTGTPYTIHFNYYTLLVTQSRVKLKWQSQLENGQVNYNELARVRSKKKMFHLLLIHLQRTQNDEQATWSYDMLQ